MTRGGPERAEVARERSRRRDKAGRGGRLGAIARSLVAAKEEQLVGEDLASGRSAELVPLQAVVPVGEEWPRIQGAIPQIFEQVSVQSIRSGLGDDVDRRAGVRAEARRQSAGLDIELLQRVRERERQIHVGHRVCIIAAVEKVSRAISLAACDGDRGGTEIILAADHAAAGSGHGSAGKQDQLSGLAAIQRQVSSITCPTPFWVVSTMPAAATTSTVSAGAPTWSETFCWTLRPTCNTMPDWE